MNVEIKMPDLATADSEVTILQWLIKVGQPVKLGQALLEIETDKASMEVESVAAGTLHSIVVLAGERVTVGSVIATIETVEAVREAETASPATAATAISAPPAAESALPTVSTALVSAAGNGQNAQRLSLFARNKAAWLAAATSALDPSNASGIALSANQREVGRRMVLSKQTVPHFYLVTSANAERMAALRARAARQANQKIAWDAFFVRAVAQALQSFDRLRYRLDEGQGQLVRRASDAIGVAADLDDALYVIAVENPLSGSLAQLSAQISDKVDRIRRNVPGARQAAETCLTITNLGAENVETFLAIVNPPESAILAVGKVKPTLTVQDTDNSSDDDYTTGPQILVQKRVSLSLSVDHRIINGKYAARFLGKVVELIEHID